MVNRPKDIIENILNTEKIYCHGLELFIEKYENPSKMMGALSSKEEHNIIFGNIVNLYALSKKMMNYFMENGVVIGFQLLIKSMSNFENYALNYLDAKYLFTKKIKDDFKFRSFIEYQESCTTSKFFEFVFYQRLPIERIYQYKEMFTCLKLNLETEYSSAIIDDILEQLHFSISKIEKYTKNSDIYEHMCKLQRKLSKRTVFDMFMPGRRLLYHCDMIKNGCVRNYIERVLLFNDVLIILQRKKAYGFGLWGRKYIIKHQWVLKRCFFNHNIMGNDRCYYAENKHICGSPAKITVRLFFT
ncbi:hypothetical protein RF11_02221 [Thelohanellus kitauei]|uniref:DH domain-containing protein n=1 Tax=Thelohanellus kitauei TaxID=669202 RepID=A0A0C2J2V5_THEKT|nr:hypothetical protein RF11_02221 [Thelohanellus kitauei]